LDNHRLRFNLGHCREGVFKVTGTIDRPAGISP